MTVVVMIAVMMVVVIVIVTMIVAMIVMMAVIMRMMCWPCSWHARAMIVNMACIMQMADDIPPDFVDLARLDTGHRWLRSIGAAAIDTHGARSFY